MCFTIFRCITCLGARVITVEQMVLYQLPQLQINHDYNYLWKVCRPLPVSTLVKYLFRGRTRKGHERHKEKSVWQLVFGVAPCIFCCITFFFVSVDKSGTTWLEMFWVNWWKKSVTANVTKEKDFRQHAAFKRKQNCLSRCECNRQENSKRFVNLSSSMRWISLLGGGV